jgi:UPF0042 nucleotide-binding protein
MKTSSRAPMSKKRIVVVTGLSGAGLSTALNVFQDNGFYCVDNLPIELLDAAVAHLKSEDFSPKHIAIGMDVRDSEFARKFPEFKVSLSNQADLTVLFLEASLDVLLNRYRSSRRKHPLSCFVESVNEAITLERTRLESIRAASDAVVDTSLFKASELSALIEDRYCVQNSSLEYKGRVLQVSLVSFGFKYGLLNEAESFHDVRFIKNPFFEPGLKNLTGQDAAVKQYVLNQPVVGSAVESLASLYLLLIPEYVKEGKHFFRIGIGCTGGRHRSVVVAEELMKKLASEKLERVKFNLVHRDISKDLEK